MSDYHEQPRLMDVRSPEAHGKTTDALSHSADRRDDILRMFEGVVPTSIMRANKAESGRHAVPGRNYAATNTQRDGRFDVSGQGVGAGALSIFPQNIGRAVVNLYSRPGDLVVDPFAGHNSRMELCVRLGRHYQGYDVSRAFMELNEAKAATLRQDYASTIRLHLQDARAMMWSPDAVGDFTITSPPYWDVEEYGDEPEQLGRLAGGYEGFLEGLAAVARENYRALRSGAYAVWFVNDFRRRGRFYPYHRDTMRVLEDAGFVIWDMMITDLGPPIRAAFATQIVDQRILPKQHEYGIVVRKEAT